jgi:FtsZ-interacting cell division protein ZipA
MYLAYKYAKRKYTERQEKKAAAVAQPSATNDDNNDGRTQSLDARADVEITSTPSPFQPAAQSSPPATSEVKEEKKQKHEETPEEKMEKSRRRKYRYKIIFGLFAPFTLQALDTTIIASALPFIAADFSK